MEKEPEGVKPQVEGATPTPAEGEKPTPTEKQPTVDKVYSQKEHDTALGKGMASINQQLSLEKRATSVAKAEAEQYKTDASASETQLKEIQTQHDDLVEKQFAGDPDARSAYVDKRTIAEERRNLAKDKADVERKLLEAETKIVQAGMGLKAQSLAAEIPGLDPKELLDTCQSEAEMEVKALRFKISQSETKEEASIFDPAVTIGRGKESLADLSPKDRVRESDKRLRAK